MSEVILTAEGQKQIKPDRILLKVPQASYCRNITSLSDSNAQYCFERHPPVSQCGIACQRSAFAQFALLL